MQLFPSDSPEWDTPIDICDLPERFYEMIVEANNMAPLTGPIPVSMTRREIVRTVLEWQGLFGFDAMIVDLFGAVTSLPAEPEVNRINAEQNA